MNRIKKGKMRYEGPDVLFEEEGGREIKAPCRKEKLFAALQVAESASPDEKSRAGAMRPRRRVGVGVVGGWLCQEQQCYGWGGGGC